ncbi:MAG: hypothetical protein K8H88_21375 [Sandaracinaceae bacterium]|nr:hypothetical protein [Sandaracinaceae bacterium]
MPTIEGLSPDELVALPDDELDVLVLSGEPITFRAGTAELLGRFARCERRLVMELAHVQGGGEGVLSMLYALAHRYARSRKLAEVEWRVHAITCPNPNLRLRQLLERRGFEAKEVVGAGLVYWKLDILPDPQPPTAGEDE